MADRLVPPISSFPELHEQSLPVTTPTLRENALRKLTDGELIALHASGGPDSAFRVLVERYNGKFLNFVKQRLKDHQMAEDAVQEAWIKINRSAALCDPTRPFFPWASTVLMNAVIDLQRKRSYQSMLVFSSFNGSAGQNQYLNPEELVESSEKPEDVKAQDSEEHSKALRCVEQLSDPHRAVIETVLLQEKSYGEAAESLSIPLGTVKSRIHAAKRRLKALFYGESTSHS